MNGFGRVRRVVATLTALTAAYLAVAAHPAAATVPTVEACTGTVRISSLTFTLGTPAPVGPTVNANAALQNCTDQRQQVQTTWFGRFVGAGGTGAGIPAGCAAIDPLVKQVDLPPAGQLTVTTGYLVFSGCTATDLQITVTVASAGTVLDQQTADFPLRPATGPCRITYQRQSEWHGGFVAAVTVTNTGPTTIPTWTVNFTFPGDQVITTSWNATVSQAGAAVTAHDQGHAAIAPGASTTFGFLGTWRTSDANPTAFTLNGTTCAG